jgi:hypothetical protein
VQASAFFAGPGFGLLTGVFLWLNYAKPCRVAADATLGERLAVTGKECLGPWDSMGETVFWLGLAGTVVGFILYAIAEYVMKKPPAA